MVRAYENAPRKRDQDSGLIERQIGSALKALYGPVVCEPLPDPIAQLIERMAALEAARRP